MNSTVFRSTLVFTVHRTTQWCGALRGMEAGTPTLCRLTAGGLHNPLTMGISTRLTWRTRVGIASIHANGEGVFFSGARGVNRPKVATRGVSECTEQRVDPRNASHWSPTPRAATNGDPLVLRNDYPRCKSECLLNNGRIAHTKTATVEYYGVGITLRRAYARARPPSGVRTNAESFLPDELREPQCILPWTPARVTRSFRFRVVSAQGEHNARVLNPNLGRIVCGDRPARPCMPAGSSARSQSASTHGRVCRCIGLDRP